MYIEEKIEKIKEFLNLVNVELNRIIGFNHSKNNLNIKKSLLVRRLQKT